MRYKAVFYTLGRLLQMLAGVLTIPLGISLYEYRATDPLAYPDTLGFLAAIALSLVLGTILQVTFRKGRYDQGVKEGFAIVTLGWVTLALLGSIPFVAWMMRTGGLDFGHAFTNAYFEIMSGFTTTGATILTDIEVLPRGLLFWRRLDLKVNGRSLQTGNDFGLGIH